MSGGEIVHRTNIKRDLALLQAGLQIGRRDRRQLRQIGERRGSRAVDGRVFQEVIRTRRQVRGHLSNEFVAIFDLQRVVRQPLGADGGGALGAHVTAA